MDTTVEIPILASPTAAHPGPSIRDDYPDLGLATAHPWDDMPGTVLLAVADPRAREELHLTLRGRGYAVLPASCGREAVNLCQSHRGPIDAVVADAALPPVDGRPLVERVGELRPAAAVLHLCNRGDVGRGPAGRRLRAPFGLKEFLAAVAETVDR